jgi:uncharacterized protein YcgL (UPF0745 family)
MKVDIYRAKKSPGIHEKIYIFVNSGAEIQNLLPPEVLKKTDGLVFEKTIDIQPGENRIALDSDEALKNLSEQGYHVQGSKIEFKVRT